jgi:hypothetical protein
VLSLPVGSYPASDSHAEFRTASGAGNQLIIADRHSILGITFDFQDKKAGMSSKGFRYFLAFSTNATI